MKTAHNLDVQRLQGVSSGLDEVNAGMDTVVNNVDTVDLVLGIKVCIEALLNVVDDWSPGLIVVDKVTETWSIYDGQTKTNAVLLNIGTE